MKAVVYERYGPPDVLELKEVEKPTPKGNEVLIRTRATTVTSGDWRARSLDVPVGFGLMSRLFFGVSRPRQPILGSELAGEIESVGKDVRKFKIGDPVFAFTGAGMGCYAEYRCVPSGGVGTAAVQLVRHFGADVTGVCSTANVELVRSLGANHVIDYTREDFTKNGETYDVIVDTVGTAPFSRSKDSLRERGRLLLVLGELRDMLQIPWVSMTSSKRVIGGPAIVRAEGIRFLAELAERGEFKPVIDRRYPFEQIVEAHRYVDTGRKKGNVIITLAHGD